MVGVWWDKTAACFLHISRTLILAHSSGISRRTLLKLHNRINVNYCFRRFRVWSSFSAPLEFITKFFTKVRMKLLFLELFVRWKIKKIERFHTNKSKCWLIILAYSEKTPWDEDLYDNDIPLDVGNFTIEYKSDCWLIRKALANAKSALNTW